MSNTNMNPFSVNNLLNNSPAAIIVVDQDKGSEHNNPAAVPLEQNQNEPETALNVLQMLLVQSHGAQKVAIEQQIAQAQQGVVDPRVIQELLRNHQAINEPEPAPPAEMPNQEVLAQEALQERLAQFAQKAIYNPLMQQNLAAFAAAQFHQQQPNVAAQFPGLFPNVMNQNPLPIDPQLLNQFTTQLLLAQQMNLQNNFLHPPQPPLQPPPPPPLEPEPEALIPQLQRSARQKRGPKPRKESRSRNGRNSPIDPSHFIFQQGFNAFPWQTAGINHGNFQQQRPMSAAPVPPQNEIRNMQALPRNGQEFPRLNWQALGPLLGDQIARENGNPQKRSLIENTMALGEDNARNHRSLTNKVELTGHILAAARANEERNTPRDDELPLARLQAIQQRLVAPEPAPVEPVINMINEGLLPDPNHFVVPIPTVVSTPLPFVSMMDSNSSRGNDGTMSPAQNTLQRNRTEGESGQSSSYSLASAIPAIAPYVIGIPGRSGNFKNKNKSASMPPEVATTATTTTLTTTATTTTTTTTTTTERRRPSDENNNRNRKRRRMSEEIINEMQGAFSMRTASNARADPLNAQPTTGSLGINGTTNILRPANSSLTLNQLETNNVQSLAQTRAPEFSTATQEEPQSGSQRKANQEEERREAAEIQQAPVNAQAVIENQPTAIDVQQVLTDNQELNSIVNNPALNDDQEPTGSQSAGQPLTGNEQVTDENQNEAEIEQAPAVNQLIDNEQALTGEQKPVGNQLALDGNQLLVGNEQAPDNNQNEMEIEQAPAANQPINILPAFNHDCPIESLIARSVNKKTLAPNEKMVELYVSLRNAPAKMVSVVITISPVINGMWNGILIEPLLEIHKNCKISEKIKADILLDGDTFEIKAGSQFSSGQNYCRMVKGTMNPDGEAVFIKLERYTKRIAYPSLIERQIQKKCNSEGMGNNVVEVIDSVSHNGHVGIVTKFFPHNNLSELAAENGGLLSDEVAAKVFSQVVNFLDYMHSMGWLHRNLSPQAVWIGTIDNTVKITELAGAFINIGNGSAFVKKMPLKWKYSSPEILEGKQIYHAEDDVWSLGVMAYEALMGVKPFEGDTPEEVLIKAKYSELVYPHPVSNGAKSFISFLLVPASARPTMSQVKEAEWIREFLKDAPSTGTNKRSCRR